jgi:hypothetical protein
MVKRSLLTLVGITSIVLATASSAFAWKPYTHVYAANKAVAQVVADDGIVINGHKYSVRPEVLDAIRRYPEYFNAGSVGPDVFPDLTYGQAVIHPIRSGEWFKHVLVDAWSTYQATGGNEDSKKVLSFAYGFLAHGAGDMWGHTLINDFAQGVFPAVTDIISNLVKIPPTMDNTRDLAIVLRHLVSEGYTTDATPGFDGNKEFGPAPGPGCPASNPLCDRSDDSTPGIPLNSPTEFIYTSMISDSASLPADSTGKVSRGPLIDFFRGFRSSLISAGAKMAPDPLQGVRDAASDLARIKGRAQAVYNACSDFDLDCIGEVISFIGGSVLDLLEAGWDFVVGELEAAVKAAIWPFVHAYLGNWVADIDDGLKHWNEFGLAFAKAMVDPQTRRNFQNEECEHVVGDLARDQCKQGVGIVSLVFHEENDFINHHLLSMIGLPDIVGEIRGAMQDAAEILKSLFCGMPVLDLVCDLVNTADAAFKALADRIVKAAVREVLGIDLEALEQVTSNMGAFMSLEQILPPELAVPIFGSGASAGINFFLPGDHNRMDGYLHLGPDHLEDAPEPFPGFPVPARRLKDDAEYVDDRVATVSNSILQAKLVMLDGPALNTVLGDVLADAGIIRDPAAIHTYAGTSASSNIMFSSLQGSEAWISMIDGDHPWRQDGLPRFCTPGSICPPRSDGGPVSTRPATNLAGGNGQYPIWESCVLRPAFSILYSDWENGSETFPELGDIVSPDPNTDNAAPQIAFSIIGPSFQSGSTLYVGPYSTFNVTATDTVFAPKAVHSRHRVYLSGTTPPDFTVSATDSSAFPLPSPTEGFWTIDLGSEDPCHTFAVEAGSPGTTDLMPPGSDQRLVNLDLTPPIITIQSPANTIFGSADTPTVSATAVDMASGLDTLTALLDGTTSVAIGGTLNLFNLAPGPHTIVFTAVDMVGNKSQASRDFRILATSASLLQNLDNARANGLIPGSSTYTNFRAMLVDAIRRHNAGDYQGERSVLNALIKAFIAARNQGTGQECPSGTMPCRVIDPPTANWFIAALAELIPNIGRTSLASNGTTLGVLEALIQEFLQGKVASRASFDELRELLTHAIDQHYQGAHSAEKDTLRTFIQDLATLLARNQPNCSSIELPCFALDSGAAARLTDAANRVIAGVYAGPDQTITLPGTASLVGAASDAGATTPPTGTTVAWTMVSGPGTVTFANAAALVTTATFSTAGTYTLRLTVTTGGASASDDMVVTVNPGPPVGMVPVMKAGLDQSITLPAIANLSGTASVNGVPNPLPLPLTTVWSKVSGPGTVTFANAAALVTTASFSVAGTYTLRLTGTYNGLTGADDVVVTVAPVPVYPCTSVCPNPVNFTINASYQSGNLGLSALCYQTTSPIHGGNCGNFVSPRTLKINGVTKSCTGGNWGSVPAAVNGGYCIQITAGNQPYSYFTAW